MLETEGVRSMAAERNAIVTVDAASGEGGGRRMTSAEVEVAVARHRSERDVTITIELEDSDQRLMIAVDGQVAFLGLEVEDSAFQFASQTEEHGRRDLIIGGQTTSIDGRYLVEVSKAAAIAREWCERGQDSAYGWWERQ